MARIHILGAGTPTPTPTRFGSAFVAQLDSTQIMVDCGPAGDPQAGQGGTVAHGNRLPLLLTITTFDHDVDYPCFLLCRWDKSIGKENRLQVYGPTLTERSPRASWARTGCSPTTGRRGSTTRQPERARHRGRHAAAEAAGRVRPGHPARPRPLRGRLGDVGRPRRARPAVFSTRSPTGWTAPRAASSSPATPSRATRWSPWPATPT